MPAPGPRVCLLTGSFYPVLGGGETYARNIAGRLRTLGVSVFVLTRRVLPTSRPYELLDGIPVYRVPPSGRSRFGKYLMLPFIAAALVRHRRAYDIVCASNFRALGPAAVLMARLLGKRCVLRAGVCGEFSGQYVTDDRAVPARARAWLAAPLALRTAVLRQADGFVSNCRAVTDEFRRGGVPDRKIVRLPGGVDTERFQPANGVDAAGARARLGLPTDRFLVGYSGKLNHGKGINHLVAALPRVLRRHPDVHLVLIGSGQHQALSQEPALRAQVRGLGVDDQVTFTGSVQDVPQYLRALDLFVLPSEYEALPNALMEAMACGLPCVASRVGGVPDLIEDGVSGRLIEPGSAPAIETAICDLRADAKTAGRLGRAARRVMEERFSLDVLAKAHRQFFAGLLNGSRHHQETVGAHP